jgi:hypothetical protein
MGNHRQLSLIAGGLTYLHINNSIGLRAQRTLCSFHFVGFLPIFFIFDYCIGGAMVDISIVPSEKIMPLFLVSFCNAIDLYVTFILQFVAHLVIQGYRIFFRHSKR